MQKAIFVLVVLTAGMWLWPLSAQAHLAGQPPFIIMNGKPSNFYPVQPLSLSQFTVPQDLAPENYLVNEPVHFTIDTTQVPVLPSALPQTEWHWQFGDGAIGSGQTIDHTYQRTGSYIATLTTTGPDAVANTMPLDIIQLNIVPTTLFQLPKITLRANGQTTEDPIRDLVSLNAAEPVRFQTEVSLDPTDHIKSYQWDFGDQESSTEANPTHRYTQDWDLTSAVVRVTDTAGFTVDQMLQLQNTTPISPTAQPTTPAPSKPSSHSPIWVGLGIATLCIVAGAWWQRSRKR